MSDEETTSRPSFSAPLYAAMRQGAKEIAQVLPAFPESVRPVEEAGTLGNPTQAMVTQEIGTVHGFQERLEDYAARGQDREQQERGMER
jgi:hypothetical protein